MTTRPQLDTFIFDLDGTLLDTIPDLVALTNMILKELGCPQRTPEEILSFVGSGVRRLIYLALPSDASQETRDEAMELWNQNFHRFYQQTRPFPGIVSMLDGLKAKGDALGVVSNKLQAGVDQIISICLPGYFSVMYGESPLVPRKPDPAGIEQAMRMLKTAPANTAYVGDSPGDIKAARNAGVYAVAVLWGYHQKEDFANEDAVPDLYVSNPEELLTLSS